MFGKFKLGFSFLELIVVIAILALLATIIAPNFRNLFPSYQRKQFIAQLNSLVHYTWQDSIVTNKLHKIVFDLKKRSISAQIRTDKKTHDEWIFEPMVSQYVSSSINWPDDTFEFKNFYINKNDAMADTSFGKGKIYFYISADGLAQPVIINLIDLKEGVSGRVGKEFSLVLNPFAVQFKEYDSFKKPE
jgi:prepilin-type N-terminal cleavage/methylation domain-containing protein